MPAAPRGGGGKSSYSMQRRLQGAVLHEFSLIEKFPQGYRNREDVTTLSPHIMVVGSQNVLTNTFQRISIRRGYALDGQRDSSRNGILSCFDWERHTGDKRHLRSGFNFSNGTGKLQYRYVATAGDKWEGNTFTKNQVYWIDLVTNLKQGLFRYTGDWWDETELKGMLLFVNGATQINEWSGGVTTLASVSNAAGVIKTWDQPGAATAISVAGPTGENYFTGDNVILNNLQTGGNTNYATASVTANIPAGQVTAAVLGGHGGGYTVSNYVALGGHGTSATIHVDTISSNAGSGYQVDDVLTLAGGGGNATFKVTVITATGQIAALALLTPGTGYAVAAAQNLVGGHGAGAQLNVTAIATGFIQKTGTKSWSEEGFYDQKLGRAVVINGNIYTYQGGEPTTYIVGISPSAAGEPLQSVIHQLPVVTPNSAIKSLPDSFNNHLIAVLNNRVVLGGDNNSTVYVSKSGNYTDFSFTSPTPIVGDGAFFTLDGVPKGFAVQRTASQANTATSTMLISAGRDVWHHISETVTANAAAVDATDTWLPQRLKTTALQGAQSQELMIPIANLVGFISNEPIVSTIGTQENAFLEPQISDLSSSIVNDLRNYDFTGGSVSFFPGGGSDLGKFLLVSIPKNNTVIMYNMSNPKDQYWEAPQIIPASCFSIIEGQIYFHSFQSSNSFQLFSGYNDDGHAVQANAVFAFNNLGVRTVRKSSTACYVEGYISSNTSLTLNLQRDLDGAASNYSTIISGADMQIVPPEPDDSSLGKNSLGKNSLGGAFNLVPPGATPPKFRVEKTFVRVEYFEEQVSFSSYGTDLIWEIIAFGTNASPASNEPTDIRE